MILICPTAKSQDFNLWEGEYSDINYCEFQDEQADNSNTHSGQWCFMVTPDAYHQPMINLKCSHTWRIDRSGKEHVNAIRY